MNSDLFSFFIINFYDQFFQRKRNLLELNMRKIFDRVRIRFLEKRRREREEKERKEELWIIK